MIVSPMVKAGNSPKPNFALVLFLTSSSREIQKYFSSSFSFNLIDGSSLIRMTKGRTLTSGFGFDRNVDITPRKRQSSKRFMFVSSSVSLTTVSLRLLSFASFFPPGNAICPDHGSPEFWTRLTKRTYGLPRFSFRSRATAALASCSSDNGLKALESFPIGKANLNQYTPSVTPRSSIKAILSSALAKLCWKRIGSPPFSSSLLKPRTEPETVVLRKNSKKPRKKVEAIEQISSSRLCATGLVIPEVSISSTYLFISWTRKTA